MPDPDRPTRERAALQRLLRRRGRRGKVGANPKTSIKSWAEYQSVSMNPTGSPTEWLRWIVMIPAIVLAFFIAFITITSMADATLRIVRGDVWDVQEWVEVLLVLNWPFLLVGGLWVYKKMDGD